MEAMQVAAGILIGGAILATFQGAIWVWTAENNPALALIMPSAAAIAAYYALIQAGGWGVS